MNPKSHTLFHFTKSKEILKTILEDGFWPRYCLEDVGWLGYTEFSYIAYPMACFCDIPLSRLDEHVNFYGYYGVGLTKEWAEQNKLTPILYVTTNSNIPKTYRDVVDATRDTVDSKKLIRYLLAHTKPTEGGMVIGGEVVRKEFHQECEWRFVPKSQSIEDYLTREKFDDKGILEVENKKTKNSCMINFSPKDVKYIFVKTDSDIPDMINFIQTTLDKYSGSDLKILMSRVTSLESIRRDL